MSTPATISITPGAGQLLDAVSLTVGLNTVVRETMVIADPTNATQLAGVTVGGALMVDASGTVQPVSGTITADQGTSPWIVAGGGTAGSPGTAVLTVQGISGGQVLPVSGTFYQATQPVSIASGQVASGAFASGSIASGAIASGAISSGAIAAGAAAAGAFADGSIFVRSANASTFPVTATIAASQTIAVTQATASSLNATVVGTLTNNNAAPAATNLGVLPARANAAAPTWTEGDQVLLSEDLSGHLRVLATGTVASGVAVSGNPVLIAGSDGTDARTISTDAGGAVVTDVNSIFAALSDGGSNSINISINSAGTTITQRSFPLIFNGSTWDRPRTANIFKTASVSATASGNTAVWTPTSGKKFRLMRFQITGTNLAATAATVITVSFQDSTTNITIGTYDVLLPAASTSTGLLQGGVQFNSGWVTLDNGFLSAAANNVLNCNISATVTGATGTFRVNACGTEE